MTYIYFRKSGQRRKIQDHKMKILYGRFGAIKDRLAAVGIGARRQGASLLLFLLVSVLASSAQTEKTVAPFQRIDAHAHIFSAPPGFYELLARWNLRILNICVVDKHDRGYEEAAPQHAKALEMSRASQGRVAWCSTFDPEDWESPSFAARSIALLNRTFADGAVAVKIYKSIGMELKSSTGQYLMPDNPVFDPVLQNIQRHGKTLYAHLAEPTSCWKPLDPASPDYEYYKANPDWHMYLHPDRPSKESILAARDRMLGRNPKLKVVGCHLGSMEVDVSEIAKRFDLYPNFAVDTAAESHT
jgi:Amidohydrolase